MHDACEKLRQAQAAVDEFYSVCPVSDDMEQKMLDLLKSGAIVKTGDFRADMVSAYALAIGSPCGAVRQ